MSNKIITKIFISIYFLVSLSVWAEDGSRVKELYSPWFISGTSSVTSLMSPQSEAINPASGAFTQRVTLNLSYITLLGEESGISGFKGHGINIGNTIPTKAGVFSWSGHYLYSPYPIINSNSTFTLNSSFSKDLYPDFLIGAGVKLAGSLEPGMSAMIDLGVISLPGNFGFFKDFSWGLALQDIGYSSISAGYPEPFTISAGISANVLKSESLKINASADLDIIGLTNFKSAALLLGSNIVFKDTFSINIGTRLDTYDLVNNNSFSIIPSIGFNYTFKTNIKENTDFLSISEKGWNRSEVQIQSGFAPISKNLWAAGLGVNIPLGVIDKSAPVIKLDISGFESDNNQNQDSEPVSLLNNVNKSYFKQGYEKRTSLASSGSLKLSSKHLIKDTADTRTKYTGKFDKKYPESAISYYMSPNNDGVKDDLTFPINITDSRYLKGYSFIIKNSNGEIVREIKNKEKRIENQGFSGFFARLFAVKSGIEIPKKFRWDGFLDSGIAAEDGLYYFSVEAWDDNGNRGSSDSYAIVLDTNAPVIKIEELGTDEKIFSPNNDGNKDIVNIYQSGSDEDLWSASIINSEGVEVRHYKWSDQVPGNLVWDGLDDSGTMVEDGVYSYEIKATDRAGNSVDAGLTNIIKNTEVTPISVTIDKSYFSPNNDMILDTLTFSPEVPVSQGIVSWKLNIKDSNGKSLRLFQGSTTIPDKIIFDGREKDSNGLRLEEGSYTGEIDVLYNNGNHPDALSPVFYVDVSVPVANIKSNGKIFSPNGDGRKDEIILYQESSTEVNWTGIIKNEKGEIIKEYQWLSAADPTVVWKGTNSEGRLAPDGLYFYQLISIDRAGNTGHSEIIEFSLNTEETAVILTRNNEYFSPNGDKSKDTISLIPELKIKEGIENYTLDILNKDSDVIRSFSGTTSMPEKFIWNGINSDGRTAKEGSYTAKLSITYTKGDAPVAVSPEFIIDTVFPEISITNNYLLFSPDSDGNKDLLLVSQSSSSEDLWNGKITDDSGNIVKSFFWKGIADNLKWDGKDDEGNPVPDGNYTYKIFSVDKAGNRTVSELKNIVIDTEPTNIFLTVSDKYLSPTGNGLFEDLTFSTIVNNKKGLDSWSLKILDKNENIEKEF
ncbi:MAG: flagellar motor protein MotB, partial [Spirochaetaceae bacterium]|nr:flagellar motor protein MotB [Spirochaetaceae bacterium]